MNLIFKFFTVVKSCVSRKAGEGTLCFGLLMMAICTLAQKIAMSGQHHVSAATFNAMRFFISTIFMMMYCKLSKRNSLLDCVPCSSLISTVGLTRNTSFDDDPSSDRLLQFEIGDGDDHECNHSTLNPKNSFSIEMERNGDLHKLTTSSSGTISGVAISSVTSQLINGETTSLPPTTIQSKSMIPLWLIGCIQGFLNFTAATFQQYGLQTVAMNKASFITSLYVVLVPLLEFILPGYPNYRRFSWYILSAVVLCIVGLSLICGCVDTEEDCFTKSDSSSGDALIFLSSFFWTASIMWTDYAVEYVDPFELTRNGFIVSSGLSFIFAIATKSIEWLPPFLTIRHNLFYILLAGFTEAVAFALTTYAQQSVDPTTASVLYSLEAVFCSIVAFVSIGEILTSMQMCGAIIMIAGSFCILMGKKD